MQYLQWIFQLIRFSDLFFMFADGHVTYANHRYDIQQPKIRSFVEIVLLVNVFNHINYSQLMSSIWWNISWHRHHMTLHKLPKNNYINTQVLNVGEVRWPKTGGRLDANYCISICLSLYFNSCAYAYTKSKSKIHCAIAKNMSHSWRYVSFDYNFFFICIFFNEALFPSFLFWRVCLRAWYKEFILSPAILMFRFGDIRKVFNEKASES